RTLGKCGEKGPRRGGLSDPRSSTHYRTSRGHSKRREGRLETWRPSADIARTSPGPRDLGLRVRRAGSEIRVVCLPCPSCNPTCGPSRSRDLLRSAETVSGSHLSRRTVSCRL